MNRLKFLITTILKLASVLIIFYFVGYHSTITSITIPLQVFAATTTCHCTIDGPTCVSEGGTPSGPGACSQGNTNFVVSCCVTTCTPQTVCSAWSAPSNTCYNGNYTQRCTETFTNCSTTSWTNSSTIDACITPQYGCVGAVCVPYWTISGAITDTD